MSTTRQDIIRILKSYDPNCNELLVNKAIDYAIKYHGSQLRESGDPYFQHPLEVAMIVAKMHLDTESIITAILHDVVEDTELTLEDIEKEFSPNIATLVDGVTKLTKLEFQKENVRQAENFRKLLLAISEDIRVLLVKLADRLHNMRTIDFIKSNEKKMRIALETSEIYGPLAERIGMQEIKLELQDIAFRILHPDIRESILKRLSDVNSDGDKTIANVISELQETLNKEGLKAKVSGRQKNPYSIWMKMKHKNVSFDQLSDIIAFRIIVKSKDDCYRALGIIHSHYKMVPDSFQDFISIPKTNGYQSLHTVVVGPIQKRIEVQIRTEEMHEVAEMGLAAHWKYKQHYQAEGNQYQWIRELLSILEHTSDPEEFLQNTKLAMYYHQVFCFTPKGSIIALPKGATTVDFAYAVHSEIGHHCVGARVNGRMVPLKTQIENGDQIEIITAKNQTPSPSWEKFVVTGRAKSEIRKFIRGQEYNQYASLGKAILEKMIKSLGISDITFVASRILKPLHKNNIEEVCISLGEGSLSQEDILKHLKAPKKSAFRSTLSFFGIGKKSLKNESYAVPVPIQGLIPGMAVHFAGCCHPLPGDAIVGVTHTGKGVTIHTTDCEMLSNFTSNPERLLDLAWDADTSNIPHTSRLTVVLSNTPGALSVLTGAIAKYDSNIMNLRIMSRSVDFFELCIDIEVKNTEHLSHIIANLRQISDVHSVERSKK
ncbi:MAG: pyrophosphokinae rsh [Pseudomonadota bacterium]|jgi:GTP pyrophosphokinase